MGIETVTIVTIDSITYSATIQTHGFLPMFDNTGEL